MKYRVRDCRATGDTEGKGIWEIEAVDAITAMLQAVPSGAGAYPRQEAAQGAHIYSVESNYSPSQDKPMRLYYEVTPR